MVVDDDVPVTLTSTAFGMTVRKTVTVAAATISTVTPANSTLTVGGTENLAIILNGLCGPSGGTVSLSSSNPNAVSVPSAVPIASGKIYAFAKVMANATTASPVVVTVTYRGLHYHVQVGVQ